MNELWTLRRSTSDVRVGGVCAALAHQWRVDPLLVRMAAIVLGLCAGVGLVLYTFAWLLTPAEGAAHSILARRFPALRTVSRPAWLGLAAVVTLLFTGAVGDAFPLGLFHAGVLVVGGAVGQHQRQLHRAEHTRRQLDTHQAPGVTTEFADASAAWRHRIAEVQGRVDSGPAPVPVATPPPLPIPRPPRPRKPTRWLTAITLVTAFTVLMVATFVLGFPAPGPSALASIVLGVGAIIAAHRGKARLLAVTTVFALVSTLGLGPTFDSTPPGLHRVATVEDVPHETLKPGDADIDLRELTLESDDHADIRASVGDLRILLPRTGTTVINFHVGVGEVKTPDGKFSGINLDETRTFGSGKPVLTLDVRLPVGEVEVRS